MKPVGALGTMEWAKSAYREREGGDEMEKGGEGGARKEGMREKLSERHD